MEIGKQIRKYRMEAKLSQDELADKVYVTRQTISNWENDRNYPDIRSLVLLGSVFGISLDILVKGVMFHLTEQLAYAKANRLPIFYTGDLIDFVSHKNLEAAQALLKDTDYFMAVGNHEFSLYVGEAFEDEAYKMQSYDFVQKHFKNDLTFANREMHGINFVAVDNSYYRFTLSQLEKLKRARADITAQRPDMIFFIRPLL